MANRDLENRDSEKQDATPIIPSIKSMPLQEKPVAGKLAEVDNAADETSLTSKMLSAVTGSVLTSLLGMLLFKVMVWETEVLTNMHIVNPLDVVRVRLQSQEPTPSPSGAFHAHSAGSSFHKLPSDLGVTTCCRQVFWVNNNHYCIAEGNLAEIGAASILPGECAVAETQSKTINSTFDGLRKIARNEGITTLWRGLSPTLVMVIPANVIYFAGYDWLRTSKRSPMKTYVSDAYAPLIAGSGARVLSALIVSPLELIRTRIQAGHGVTAAENFKETMSGVSDMIKSRGYTSLWRGLTLTLWRDVPFSALYWWGYESARNALSDMREGRIKQSTDTTASLSAVRSAARKRQNHSTTLMDSFLAGGLAGAAASVVTTPFDVGKTRQQTEHHRADTKAAGPSVGKGSPGGVGARPIDGTIPRFLWHIFKTEGMPGLFKGWSARVLKVAPACAIMISSYEVGKKMAGKPSREDIE